MRTSFPVAALGAALSLALAGPAAALKLVYTIDQGADHGFGYSSLHDADDDTPMSGSILGHLNGDLVLDYDAGADLYTFVSSSVVLSGAAYSFELTGGQIAGDGGGRLDFTLRGAGPFAQATSFLFAGGPPVCCGPAGPNYVNETQLRLWGASDVPISGGLPGAPRRLGMDLGGNARPLPVPEPSSAATFAVGALLVAGSLRRRGRLPVGVAEGS